MPKVYYYTDSQVGAPWPGPDADRVEYCKQYNIPHPRFVWYGWPNFEETTNPTRADVFCVRQRLVELEKSQITALPFYKGDARHRHVFFSLGPDMHPKIARDFSKFPGIFVRAVVNQTMLKADPDIVVWPWPTDDLGKFMHMPPGGFKYDAVYQGHWKAYPGDPTKSVLDALRKAPLNLHIVDVPQFWPTIRDREPARGAQLRKSFCEGIQASRLAICPNSNINGGMRYRFYEALSMGRVNFCTGDKYVLPLKSKINWEDCLIYLPESTIPRMGQIMADWLKAHTDSQIMKMGLEARATWQKWLWRGRWGEVLGGIVRERLGL